MIVSVSVSKVFRDKMRAAAKEAGINYSELMRRALDFYLDSRPAKKESGK